ncbi:hypothetical protein ACSSS7_007592 [Eimeria intestinalis]
MEDSEKGLRRLLGALERLQGRGSSEAAVVELRRFYSRLSNDTGPTKALLHDKSFMPTRAAEVARRCCVGLYALLGSAAKGGGPLGVRLITAQLLLLLTSLSSFPSKAQQQQQQQQQQQAGGPPPSRGAPLDLFAAFTYGLEGPSEDPLGGPPETEGPPNSILTPAVGNDTFLSPWEVLSTAPSGWRASRGAPLGPPQKEACSAVLPSCLAEGPGSQMSLYSPNQLCCLLLLLLQLHGPHVLEANVKTFTHFVAGDTPSAAVAAAAAAGAVPFEQQQQQQKASPVSPGQLFAFSSSTKQQQQQQQQLAASLPYPAGTSSRASVEAQRCLTRSCYTPSCSPPWPRGFFVFIHPRSTWLRFVCVWQRKHRVREEALFRLMHFGFLDKGGPSPQHQRQQSQQQQPQQQPQQQQQQQQQRSVSRDNAPPPPSPTGAPVFPGGPPEGPPPRTQGAVPHSESVRGLKSSFFRSVSRYCLRVLQQAELQQQQQIGGFTAAAAVGAPSADSSSSSNSGSSSLRLGRNAFVSSAHLERQLVDAAALEAVRILFLISPADRNIQQQAFAAIKRACGCRYFPSIFIVAAFHPRSAGSLLRFLIPSLVSGGSYGVVLNALLDLPLTAAFLERWGLQGPPEGSCCPLLQAAARYLLRTEAGAFRPPRAFRLFQQQPIVAAIAQHLTPKGAPLAQALCWAVGALLTPELVQQHQGFVTSRMPFEAEYVWVCLQIFTCYFDALEAVAYEAVAPMSPHSRPPLFEGHQWASHGVSQGGAHGASVGKTADGWTRMAASPRRCSGASAVAATATVQQQQQEDSSFPHISVQDGRLLVPLQRPSGEGSSVAGSELPPLLFCVCVAAIAHLALRFPPLRPRAVFCLTAVVGLAAAE